MIFPFKNLLFKFVFTCTIVFAAYSVKAQQVNCQYGNKISTNAGIVGHFDEAQNELLESHYVSIISYKDLLKNNNNQTPKGVIDSLYFDKPEGCGLKTKMGGLTIYLKKTNRTTIDTNHSSFTGHLYGAELVFNSDTFSISDNANYIGIPTNRSFNYSDTSNIMVIMEWRKPIIASCLKIGWLGAEVSDSTAMTWSTITSNFKATDEKYFKLNTGFKFDSSIDSCSNNISFNISDLNGGQFAIKLNGASALKHYVEVVEGKSRQDRKILDLKTDKTFITVSKLSKNTIYSVYVTDGCVPTSYNLFNLKSSVRTTCEMPSLDSVIYSEGFERAEDTCMVHDDVSFALKQDKGYLSDNGVALKNNSNNWLELPVVTSTKGRSLDVSFVYAIATSTIIPIDEFYLVYDSVPLINGSYLIADTIKDVTSTSFNYHNSYIKPAYGGKLHVGFVLPNQKSWNTLFIDQIQMKFKSTCSTPELKDLVRRTNGFQFSSEIDTFATVGYKIDFLNEKHKTLYPSAGSRVVNSLTNGENYKFSVTAICSQKDTSLSTPLYSVFVPCVIDSLSNKKNISLTSFESLKCIQNISSSGNVLVLEDGYNGSGIGSNTSSKKSFDVVAKSIYLEKDSTYDLQVYVKVGPYYGATYPSIHFKLNQFGQPIDTLVALLDSTPHQSFYRMSAEFTPQKTGVFDVNLLGVNSEKSLVIDELSISKGEVICPNILGEPTIDSSTGTSAFLRLSTLHNNYDSVIIKVNNPGLERILTFPKDSSYLLSNLKENSKITGTIQLVCESGKSLNTSNFSFHTPIQLDTVGVNDSTILGFETSTDLNYLSDLKGFERLTNDSSRYYKKPIKGRSYLYSSYTKTEVTRHSLYLLQNSLYELKYDYLKKFAAMNVVFSVLNKQGNKVYEKTIILPQGQQRGTASSLFHCEVAGEYSVVFSAEKFFTIDNLGVVWTTTCSTPEPSIVEVVTHTDSLYLVFPTDSILSSLHGSISSQNKKIQRFDFTPDSDGVIKTNKIASKMGHVFDCNYYAKCGSILGIHKSLRYVTPSRNFDTLRIGKIVAYSFDTISSLEDLSIISRSGSKDHIGLLNNYAQGFSCISGSNFINITGSDSSTDLPLFHFIEGTSVDFRLFYSQNNYGSSQFIVRLLSQTFSDTFIVDTLKTSSLANGYFYAGSLIPITKSGNYFIELSPTVNTSSFVIDNISLQVIAGTNATKLEVLKINATKQKASIAINKSPLLNAAKYKIEAYNYGGYLIDSAVSTTSSSGINDTLLEIDNLVSGKHYHLVGYVLDSSNQKIDATRLISFATDCAIDTIKNVGQFDYDDFENGIISEQKALCGLQSSTASNIKVQSRRSNDAASGLYSVVRPPMSSRDIYVYKDSTYLISANLKGVGNSVFFSTNNVNPIFTNGVVFYGFGDTVNINTQNKWENHSRVYKPPHDGKRRFGITSNGSSNPLKIDDFTVTRIDSFMADTLPLLTLGYANNLRIPISWKTNHLANAYIIQTTINNSINSNDTIFNLALNTDTIHNLKSGSRYTIKIGYQYSNNLVIWSSPVSYSTSCTVDTVHYGKPYTKDFESQSMTNVECMMTDKTWEFDNAISGTGVASLKYRSNISTSDTAILCVASVYLESGKKYEVSFDYLFKKSNQKSSLIINDKRTVVGGNSVANLYYSSSPNFNKANYLFRPSTSKTYYFMVDSKLTSYNQINIDNIKITAVGPCSAGTGNIKLVVDTLSSQETIIHVDNSYEAMNGFTVDVNDYPAGQSGSKSYDYFDTALHTLNDTIFTLKNLQHYRAYKMRVKANCYDGLESAWSDWVNFTTACYDSIEHIDSTNSYFVDFNYVSSPIFPECWESSAPTIDITNHRIDFNNSQPKSGEGSVRFSTRNRYKLYSKTVTFDTANNYSISFLSSSFNSQDSIFLSIIRQDSNIVIADTVFSSYDNGLYIRTHSMDFIPKYSGRVKLVWTGYNDNQKWVYSSLGFLYIDNVMIKQKGTCEVDSIALSYDFFKASAIVKKSKNSLRNDLEIVSQTSFKKVYFSSASSLDTVTVPTKGNETYLIKQRTYCVNGDSSDLNVISFTNPLKYKTVDQNGYCESFIENPSRDEFVEDWTSTGSRIYFSSVQAQRNSSGAISISNKPSNAVKVEGLYNLHRIESPALKLTADTLYNISSKIYLEDKLSGLRSWDYMYYTIYNVVTGVEHTIMNPRSLSYSGTFHTHNAIFYPKENGIYTVRTYIRCLTKTYAPYSILGFYDFCINPVNQSCAAPFGLKTVVDSTKKQINFVWGKVQTAKKGYEWYIVKNGSSRILYSGTNNSILDTSAKLYDLIPGEEYKFNVRSKCNSQSLKSSDQLFSGWSSNGVETAACYAQAIDSFVMFDFENTSQGELLPQCFTQDAKNYWRVIDTSGKLKPLSGKKYLQSIPESYASVTFPPVDLKGDSNYTISLNLMSDGGNSCDSLVVSMIDPDGAIIKLRTLSNLHLGNMYTTKVLHLTAPRSGFYKLKLEIYHEIYSSYHWFYNKEMAGLAIDDVKIAKTKNCATPQVLSISTPLDDQLTITIDSFNHANAKIVLYRSGTSLVDSLPLDSGKVVYNLDKSKLNQKWSMLSIRSGCSDSAIIENEFVMAPRCKAMKFTTDTIYDYFISNVRELSMPNCWIYSNPNEWTMLDSNSTSQNQMASSGRGYLTHSSFRAGSDTIYSPRFYLEKYQKYGFSVALSNNRFSNFVRTGLYNFKTKETKVLSLHIVKDGIYKTYIDSFKVQEPGDYAIFFIGIGGDFSNDRQDRGNITMDDFKIFKSKNSCEYSGTTSTLITETNRVLLKLNTANADPVLWHVQYPSTQLNPTYIDKGKTKSGNSFWANNLLPSTKYSLYVQRVCPNQDTAAWVLADNFITPCASDTITYDKICEDFETADTSETLCTDIFDWKVIKDGSNKYLHLRGGQTTYIRSNKFLAKDEGSIDISVKVKANKNYGIDSLVCYVMDLSTGIKYYGNNPLNDTLIIDFKPHKTNVAIPHRGMYQVVVIAKASNMQYGEIFIDDFCYSLSNRCLGVKEASVSNVEKTRITVSWKTYNQADSMYIGFAELTPNGYGSYKYSTRATNNTSFTLNDLNPGTFYKIRINPVCNSTNSDDISEFDTSTICLTDTVTREKYYIESFTKSDKHLKNNCFETYGNYYVDTISSNSIEKIKHSRYLVAIDPTGTFNTKEILVKSGKTYKASLFYKTVDLKYTDSITYGILDDSYNEIARTSIVKPNNTNYLKDSFDYTSKSNGKVHLFIKVYGPDTVFIDALKLEEKIKCDFPIGLKINKLSSFDVEFNWYTARSEHGYDLELKNIDKPSLDPFIFASDSSKTANSISVNDGIFPGNSYQVRIKSKCINDYVSDWSHNVNFTVPCPTYSLDELNRFGNISYNDSSWMCWYFENSINDSSYDWRRDTTLTTSKGTLFDNSSDSITNYLSTFGVDIKSSSIVSTIKTPTLRINSNGVNRILSFDIAKKTFSTVEENRIENNELVVLFEGSKNTIDTLLRFNGDIRSAWTTVHVEIPDNLIEGRVVFQYHRSGTSPVANDLAIDNVKINTGQCEDLFNKIKSTDEVNNVFCINQNSKLFVGQNKSLSYTAKVVSKDGISLNLANVQLDNTVYNLSKTNTFIDKEFLVVSGNIFNSKSKDSMRINGVSDIALFLPKIALINLNDSASKIVDKPSHIKYDSLIAFTSEKVFNIKEDSLKSIDSGSVNILKNSAAVTSGYWALDSQYDAYKFSLLFAELQQNFIVGYIGEKDTSSNGVSNSILGNGVMIYPNPTSRSITIDASRSNLLYETIEVFDGIGKLVATKRFGMEAVEKIDLSKVSPGLFYVRISSANHKYKVYHKVLKY